ncbi:HAD family hydrolase [Paludisphaera mucosa]|uniref:HAD family phosphatase n=1 Tax=Paludisphaera mucosa TaxID=3030827 RepID=A0ABT6FDJ9_9BACT|nr:HAD family phosphatase [Paludisphaera mucosa]MDG3005646.1 HAD family phosphatase [Paludisphaera mucosa]
MPPTIDAVAFDLDGLMFDTEALFFRVACETLEARGGRFTAEIMAAMIGRRSVEAGHVLQTMSGVDAKPEELLADVRERFLAVVDTDVAPTAGLLTLLDRLRDLGVPAAVATSSRRAYAERLLNGHGLRDRFAFLLGSEDVKRGKPEPEIYLKAAEGLGVAPECLMVLEDSPAGVAAARAAGAFVVAVPHEHSVAEGLGLADLIVPRLDAPALLARLGG